MPDVIDSFRDDYRFLSNFYPSELKYKRIVYPTVEHAYQCAKDSTSSLHLYMCRNGVWCTAGDAKQLGRRITTRIDWDNIKYGIMKVLVTKKFENEDLKEKLLKTGNAKLIEGNTWGDEYWGVCKGKGKNKLGIILMKVRETIRNNNG